MNLKRMSEDHKKMPAGMCGVVTPLVFVIKGEVRSELETEQSPREAAPTFQACTCGTWCT